MSQCKHALCSYPVGECAGYCQNSVTERQAASLPPAEPTPKALDVQIGGGHYKDMAIQPVEFIHRNGIPFIEGCVIKYVSRWRAKGGIEDIKKARHFLDLLIELESAKRAS